MSMRFAAGFTAGAWAKTRRAGSAVAAAKPPARNWRRPMQQPQENKAIVVFLLVFAAQRPRLVVVEPAACLLAQIGPDLRDVAAERLARHDFRCAWPRQLYIDRAFHPSRAIGHHQDAVGELHRLGDVVGDQQHRLIQLLLDLQHLVAEQEPRLLVERGEWLVHQQDFRLRRQRARHRYALAHAAGELGRITLLKTVKPDHGHEMPGALDTLTLRHAGDFQWEGDVVDDVAPGEGRLLLEHHADRSVRAVDLFAGDRDPAVVAAEQAADDVEQG